MKKLNRDLIINDLSTSRGFLVAYALLNNEFVAIDRNLILHIYSTEKNSAGYSLKKIIYEIDLYETKEVIKEVKLIKTMYHLSKSHYLEFLDVNQAASFENFLRNQSVNLIELKKLNKNQIQNKGLKDSNNNSSSSFLKKRIHSNWIIIWILITSLLAFATPGFLLITLILAIYALVTTKPVKTELIDDVLNYEDFKAESENLKKDLKILNADIKNAEIHLSNLNEDYRQSEENLKKDYEQKQERLDNEYFRRKNELIEIEKSLNKKYTDLETSDIEINNFEEVTAAEIKDQLSLISLKEKDLNKQGGVKIQSNDFQKSFLNNQIKQIFRTFNVECDFYFSNVTAKNIDTYRNRIVRAFEAINRIYKKDGVELSQGYLKLKLQKLNYIYEYEVKKEQEKELQKAAREQMLEEQRVQQEIERQRKEIAKEEKHFSNEVNKLMKYINKTDSEVEKELYLSKIKELEEKLSELEIDKKDVDNRAANTRAGYVYVISNIGSFGENIYKIGVTRRLQPMDRVNELSSASVPFPFDVHAMIFSDDAPKLENTLHQYFRDKEINKVNPRKEFFNVSLGKIEEVVKENHNDTVIFTRIPQATEFRETEKITEKNREKAAI